MMALADPREQVRAFYDRFGAKQDSQAFYEDAATADLILNAELGAARAVFEFGCGTGRFAEKLLAEHLPADCSAIPFETAGRTRGER